MESDSLEVEDDVQKDLQQMERAYLTGRLWDQRFQGNRFVILDQELIHDSQDKPIDLNQGKKDFNNERDEYKINLNQWYGDYQRRCEIIEQARISRHREVKLNTEAKEFHLSNSHQPANQFDNRGMLPNMLQSLIDTSMRSMQ